MDTKNKHQNVYVTGTVWDMQKIEDRNMKKKWFIFLDILLVVFILIGIAFIYYAKNYTFGIILIIIGLLILTCLVFRKRTRRNRNFNKQRYSRNRKFIRRRINRNFRA